MRDLFQVLVSAGNDGEHIEFHRGFEHCHFQTKCVDFLYDPQRWWGSLRSTHGGMLLSCPLLMGCGGMYELIVGKGLSGHVSGWDVAPLPHQLTACTLSPAL